MIEERLKGLKKRINTFAQERDWEQFHDPKNLALSLQLEASELLELFQWTKDNNIQKGKEDQLGEELADIFYWLLKLSDHYNIDLITALEAKMDKNEKKYPIDKAKGKPDKYTQL